MEHIVRAEKTVYKLGALFLVSLVLFSLLVKCSEIVVTVSQPNSHTRLLPLQEWAFSTGNFDGLRVVTIERKYGFIEVTTSYPR